MNEFRRVIPEEKLVVVNFRTKNYSPELKNWRAQYPVAVAESCDRQVWFGTAETFRFFPKIDSEKIHVLSGRDAYAFLLKLLTGMDSTKKGETNIKGQFYADWENFKAGNPDCGVALESVMQHIKADCRFIQSQILEGFKMHEHALAARDLSGLKKGENVLFVGHINRHGNLGDFGEKLVRAVNSRPFQAHSLIMTHPDKVVANAIAESVRDLQARGIVKARLEKISFEDLPLAVELTDHAFIDFPMGQMTVADEFMVDVWRSRENQESKLVHMRGNPLNRGESDAIWKEAGLQNYIAPEDVRAEMARRGQYNKELTEIAEAAFVYCADVRVAGGRLSERIIRDFKKNHLPNNGLGSNSVRVDLPSTNPQPH